MSDANIYITANCRLLQHSIIPIKVTFGILLPDIFNSEVKVSGNKASILLYAFIPLELLNVKILNVNLGILIQT